MKTFRSSLLFLASCALVYFGHNGYPSAWIVWQAFMWFTIVITALVLVIPAHKLTGADVRVNPIVNGIKIFGMGALLIWVGASPGWVIAYTVCAAILHEKSKEILTYKETH